MESRYRLGARIGTGGMAEVFRATRHCAAGIEKSVALKRILPALRSVPGIAELFRAEAHAMAGLNHANICQVFDYGEDDDGPYLALELVEGIDLGHVAAANAGAGTPMAPALAAYIVAQIAWALDYAHQRRNSAGEPLGLVHRDVSPENILLSRSGEVKLTDFGICQSLGQHHTTGRGLVLGKVRYMSPEQVSGQTIDHRSDLFSLGVILFELLTATMVFAGVTGSSVRVGQLIQSTDAPPPSSRAAGISPELDRIVGTALIRQTAVRYQSAAELARELDHYVASTAPGFTREHVARLVASLDAPRARATGAVVQETVLTDAMPSGVTMPAKAVAMSWGAPAWVNT